MLPVWLSDTDTFCVVINQSGEFSAPYWKNLFPVFSLSGDLCVFRCCSVGLRSRRCRYLCHAEGLSVAPPWFFSPEATFNMARFVRIWTCDTLQQPCVCEPPSIRRNKLPMCSSILLSPLQGNSFSALNYVRCILLLIDSPLFLLCFLLLFMLPVSLITPDQAAN